MKRKETADMTIEEMKQKKREFGYSAQELSGLSGVPVGTLQKIFSGATQYPRRETLRKLEQILGRTAPPEQKPAYLPAGAVKESETVYRPEGRYTLEDYLALPDDRRAELIDGVFYDMAAPTTFHQGIGGFIYKQLLDFVLEHRGPCMPLVSPVTVVLDEDNRTAVEPDVVIVCDRNKFQKGRIFGAPDLVVEVLSPSTRRKDMSRKLFKYTNAGVREYWLVDPDKKTVVVYDLEHDEIPALYGFEEQVPVLVWEGRCRVDFAAIDAFCSFLYES